MGRDKAERPRRLAEKLRQVRIALGFTQDEMARALEKQKVKVYRAYVSLYETGERVPSIPTILAYARIANVSMESLCDDEMDLP